MRCKKWQENGGRRGRWRRVPYLGGGGGGFGGFDHLDKGAAGLLRVGNLAGKVEAEAVRACGAGEAEGEAEAVDGGDVGVGGGLGICIAEGLGEQEQGVLVVGVEVREDVWRGGRERVGLGERVFGSLNPAHDAETADVVELDGLDAEEVEVGELDPVTAAGVAGEVQFAGLGQIGWGNLLGEADEGGTGSTEGVPVCGGFADEEAGVGVGAEVVGVHGHVANEQQGGAGWVEGVGHERAEGKTGMFARLGAEGGGVVEVEQGTGALCMGGLGQQGGSGAGKGVLAGCWGRLQGRHRGEGSCNYARAVPDSGTVPNP